MAVKSEVKRFNQAGVGAQFKYNGGKLVGKVSAGLPDEKKDAVANTMIRFGDNLKKDYPKAVSSVSYE